MIADVLLALHVLGAVLWVGGMFFALMVLRPSLAALSPPQRLDLGDGVARFVGSEAGEVEDITAFRRRNLPGREPFALDLPCRRPAH